jgi:hypothetical protein
MIKMFNLFLILVIALKEGGGLTTRVGEISMSHLCLEKNKKKLKSNVQKEKIA